MEALGSWVAELHEALLGEPFVVRDAAEMETRLDRYKVRDTGICLVSVELCRR